MLHHPFIPLLVMAGSIACWPLASGPAVPASQPGASGARLLVHRDVDAGFVRVVALYDAPADAPDSLRYELEVLRAGQAGRSSSQQGGTVVPHPGRTDTLSTSRVNVSVGDRLQIHLRLYADQRLVGEAHHDAVISTSD